MADALSRLANAEFPKFTREILLEVLEQPSIQESKPVDQVHQLDDWTTPIRSFLETGALPDDLSEARKVTYRASRYTLLDGVLYKRSLTMPLLRCLGRAEAFQVLSEVHGGECGNHLGARSLAHKILRQGYYWPTMQQDTTEFVKKCNNCQFYSNLPRKPATEMTPLSYPVPFAQWGIDLFGPLPTAPGGRRWVILAVDYFTKWVEGEALASITQQRVTSFLWRSIICRFGIPRVLITDNGTQFEANAFREFTEGYGIKHYFSSVAHPQCNGQAEVTVRTITKSLETRLGEASGKWADELPGILWAYRTTSRAPTGETPFLLAFGAEAVVPVEVGVTSARLALYNPEGNEDLLRADKDLLEERRERAALHNAAYKQRMVKYHNARVRPRHFQAGDLVLRKVEATGQHVGKLAPNWEGPFRVRAVVRPGTYNLERLDGTRVPRSWNTEHLRMYYQ